MLPPWTNLSLRILLLWVINVIMLFSENACNFFRWRDHEDVDIRSIFVILRLANRIKELKIDDENHIKRSNKCVMKEKKKKCVCNKLEANLRVVCCGFFFYF
ncbi:hypothetical protein H5410_006222 [Solanum commersonii]|uniref:Uncharacterized protein n=1 Tax=Solanum commersonii TaxID=4109 RepID=A0A9J6A9K0_SOLCO|nr:hypothetical protein H5410_006222 [Solanum commersonii]